MEIWKEICGYEGQYAVSTFGRVKSLTRVVRQESRAGVFYDRAMREKILAPRPDSTGRYLLVNLSTQNSSKNFSVHRVVLEAFVGSCPVGMEGCHNDGNPLNNRLDNLRWDTKSSNNSDKVAHGTDNRGERQHNATLTNVQVAAIKSEIKLGDRIAVQVAKLFGTTPGVIRSILRGERWVHVDSAAIEAGLKTQQFKAATAMLRGLKAA